MRARRYNPFLMKRICDTNAFTGLYLSSSCNKRVSIYFSREQWGLCLFTAADWFAAARTLGNEIYSIMTVKTLVWRKVLVYCSTVNPNLLFRPYKQKRNLWNLQLFYDDIEKEENFLDTRDNSYKFRYFRFLALQNLQLKQPLNWLNSTL